MRPASVARSGTGSASSARSTTGSATSGAPGSTSASRWSVTATVRHPTQPPRPPSSTGCATDASSFRPPGSTPTYSRSGHPWSSPPPTRIASSQRSTTPCHLRGDRERGAADMSPGASGDGRNAMSDGLIRSPDLPKDATVVVIGGGVMGTSTAYQLTRAGIRDLVLLEANELASGSSGKPLGGVRAQFSDPANIELGARSLRAFRRFDEDFGVDIGYQ